MSASIVFGLAVVVLFVTVQTYNVGKSVFERSAG